MSNITGPVSEINYNGVAVPLSASGGEKLYRHYIQTGNQGLRCIIYTNSPEIMTFQSTAQWLYENGFTKDYLQYPINYLMPDKKDADTVINFVSGWYSSSGASIQQRENNIKFSIVDGNISTSYPTLATSAPSIFFTDTVSEL